MLPDTAPRLPYKLYRHTQTRVVRGGVLLLPVARHSVARHPHCGQEPPEGVPLLPLVPDITVGVAVAAEAEAAALGVHGVGTKVHGTVSC